MAILFIEDLSTSNLYGCFDNHELKYKTNTVKTPTHSNVTIDGKTFRTTPDPNKIFSFDISEVVRTLMNVNLFNDEMIVDLTNTNEYRYADATLSKSVTVEFKIVFDDASEELTTRNYEFIKSVHKVETYEDEVLNIQDENIALLLPFIDDSNNNYYSPYYHGFPFDFQLYSKTSTTITIKNLLTEQSISKNVLKGVSRMFLSDGLNNSTLIGDLPIIRGTNELEISDSLGNKLYLTVERFDTCGSVFKYVNSKGGYSYTSFDKYNTEELKTNTNDEIQSEVANITKVTENSLITGKRSMITKDYVKSRVTRVQQKHFEEIYDSPRVWIYNGKGHDAMRLKRWFGITVKDDKYDIKGRRNINDRYMTIESIKKTQTY